MPLLTTLVDNFNDGTLGPEWGNSYGGTTETGGRVRVPCSTGFAGCQTAYSWTLAGATFFVKVPTVPVASGAAEAYCGVLVNSSVGGTRIGFIINAVTGTLRCVNETGYFDPASVDLTYNGTAHAFIRLREDGTNVYWDTSSDGSTWTNRRTLATPAWILTEIDTCALDMSAHRDAGTPDYAEFDLFNTLSDGAVHTGTGTGSAQSSGTATGVRTATGAGSGTAQTAAAAAGIATHYGTASGSAQSDALAVSAGIDTSDVLLRIGRARGRWAVSEPWT